MGVNGLWTILQPCEETVPLADFKGATLAVDLGVWLVKCQEGSGYAQEAAAYEYLRTMFYRIKCLSSLGIRAVFVADGLAPKLKKNTMQNRYKGSGGNLLRTGFRYHLKQCTKLATVCGYPMMNAIGEAEATCGALNLNGLVDAVVTEDVDAFLYGADVVLKGFSVAGKTPTIKMYRMDAIREKLGLDREKLIAIALFSGCDFSNGVPMIGPKTIEKKLKDYETGEEFLQRLAAIKSGQIDESQMTETDKWVVKKTGAVPNLPLDSVINEFTRDRKLPTDLKRQTLGFWTQPDYEKLMSLLEDLCDWPKRYSNERVIELMCEWTLVNRNPPNSQFRITSVTEVQGKKDGEKGCLVNWLHEGKQKLKFMTIRKESELVDNHLGHLIPWYKKSSSPSKGRGRKPPHSPPSALSEGSENDLSEEVSSISSCEADPRQSESEPIAVEVTNFSRFDTTTPLSTNTSKKLSSPDAKISSLNWGHFCYRSIFESKSSTTTIINNSSSSNRFPFFWWKKVGNQNIDNSLHCFPRWTWPSNKLSPLHQSAAVIGLTFLTNALAGRKFHFQPLRSVNLRQNVSI